HQHAVRLTIQRCHHIETRQRRVELLFKSFAGHTLDEAAGAQQPDPNAQTRFRVGSFYIVFKCRRSGGRRHPVSPPETAIAWPLTAPLSPAHSHMTASATSSGLMNRACGLLASSVARVSSPVRLVAATIRSTARSSIGVSAKPGQTALTVIPVLAVSSARARAS